MVAPSQAPRSANELSIARYDHELKRLSRPVEICAGFAG
jgi:hypothetical protein